MTSAAGLRAFAEPSDLPRIAVTGARFGGQLNPGRSPQLVCDLIVHSGTWDSVMLLRGVAVHG